MTARERRDRLRKRRADLRRQGQQQNDVRRLEALLEHPDFWRSRLDAGLALELEPSPILGRYVTANLGQTAT